MKNLYLSYLKKFIQMCCGFFITAVGITISVQAALGLSPWDVFHMGISMQTGIPFGRVNVMVGFIIVIIDFFMKEKIGFGTIANMLLIGTFTDMVMSWNIIPVFTNIPLRVCMMVLSVFMVALGTYFYISTGLGGGPRDSFMLVLLHRTKLPVYVARTIIEGTALALGWLLGGPVGIGTIIAVLCTGPSLDIVFKLFKFDVGALQHESVKDTLQKLKKA